MKNLKIKWAKTSIDRTLKITDMDLIPVSIFNFIISITKFFPKIHSVFRNSSLIKKGISELGNFGSTEKTHSIIKKVNTWFLEFESWSHTLKGNVNTF